MRRLIMASLAWIFAIALLLGCGSFSRTAPQAAPPAAPPPAAPNPLPGPPVYQAPPAGDGIYLASWIVTSLQDTPAGWALYGFDANTFPFGIRLIGIVNRWNGAQGAHTDRTALVDREGRVVRSSETPLEGTRYYASEDPELSQTVMIGLETADLAPGPYTVVIALDGREYARYTIRILGPAQTSAPPSRN